MDNKAIFLAALLRICVWTCAYKGENDIYVDREQRKNNAILRRASFYNLPPCMEKLP